MTNSSIQEVVALLGQPVAGNPTQFMMERALAAAGLSLDWRYLTLEIAPEQLADAIRGMRAMGFRGANITIPHKVAVIAHLDGLSEAARLMGAVNFIRRQDGQLWGENTDGKGFIQSLSPVVDPAGKHVVILGAGGAARAISVELALAGAAAITIVNRSPERGQELASLLADKLHVQAQYAPWVGDLELPDSAAVLVNATSIGLGSATQRVPLDLKTLKPDVVVADVIFNPLQTRLIREAREHGCRTLDGLGMLVHQAAIAFRLWTGLEPDATVMREAVEEFLGL